MGFIPISLIYMKKYCINDEHKLVIVYTVKPVLYERLKVKDWRYEEVT